VAAVRIRRAGAMNKRLESWLLGAGRERSVGERSRTESRRNDRSNFGVGSRPSTRVLEGVARHGVVIARLRLSTKVNKGFRSWGSIGWFGWPGLLGSLGRILKRVGGNRVFITWPTARAIISRRSIRRDYIGRRGCGAIARLDCGSISWDIGCRVDQLGDRRV